MLGDQHSSGTGVPTQPTVGKRDFFKRTSSRYVTRKFHFWLILFYGEITFLGGGLGRISETLVSAPAIVVRQSF